MPRPNRANITAASAPVRRPARLRNADYGYKNIKSEGGLIPFEVIESLAVKDNSIGGLTDKDYQTVPGEKLDERISYEWHKLLKTWYLFRKKISELPDTDEGTSVTRKEWLVPLLLSLGFNPKKAGSGDFVIDEKPYSLSHKVEQPIALHLVSFKQNLDERPIQANLRRISPHSLVQEFLNRSERHLWGYISNGYRFRIIRDTVSYTRSSYIEFDLETIMNTESFGEFRIFYLLAHATRVTNRSELIETDEETDDENAEPVQAVDHDSWIELWHKKGNENGVRLLNTLSEGVRYAVSRLGSGFISHRANSELRTKNTPQAVQDFYKQLLQLVYKIIFLLIAEDRDLLFTEDATPETRELYDKYYSISRIRTLARYNRGSRHSDIWEQLTRTLAWLGTGEETLGIPEFGSALFKPEFTADLNNAKIRNRDLLAAIRYLTYTNINGTLQLVNYRSLGSEELGSIYESLLEMHPESTHTTFELKIAAGNDRKTTGSYYTPPELVNQLIKTALIPVMEKAISAVKTTEEQEKALLNLKVCDPACGSGHFLIGAAHAMGYRLAQIRTGDDTPNPAAIKRGIHDVIAHSIYGVDLNPMAVELCKVSLWIESMVPGKGLVFLDHKIRCGNSLLGATPELLKSGIPDDAYTDIEGDDKGICSKLKKRNRKERKDAEDKQQKFEFDESDTFENRAVETLRHQFSAFVQIASNTAEDYAVKEKKLADLLQTEEYRTQKLAADLWCSAFVWEKKSELDTPTYLNHALASANLPGALNDVMRCKIAEYADRYQFFHWFLEFPEVFNGDDGGFDVVLGNPPWEQVQFNEKEWFAPYSRIVNANNAVTRKRLIDELRHTNPELYSRYQEALRISLSSSYFIRNTDLYPLCGHGKINTYTIFTELNRKIISPSGQVGCIVPSGIASDDTTKDFFADLMACKSLSNFYDFENRKKIFPAVDSRFKFALLTMNGETNDTETADFSFFNLSVADLAEKEKHFSLTQREISQINPNTRNCAIFRSGKDAVLTKAVYRRRPVIIKEAEGEKPEENIWKLRFKQMFNMASDSGLFNSAESLLERGFKLAGNHFVKGDGEEKEVFLPLYEAKMIHHFTHRFGDYADLPSGSKSTKLPEIDSKRLADTDYTITPRYWVDEKEVLAKADKNRLFLFGWRNIARVTDERTIISSILSISAVGHSMQLYFSELEQFQVIGFAANLNSFCADYVARQKVGGTNLTHNYFKQFPIIPPEVFCDQIQDFVVSRVLELTYTANDMRPFAESLGYTGEPFIWDERRRFVIRAELDALFFGLYLGWSSWSKAAVYSETPEQYAELTQFFPEPVDALDYMMSTFPIVERHERADEIKRAAAKEFVPGLTDEELDGKTYPSHALIRHIFLQMAQGVASGTSYVSQLSPKPGEI